MSIVANYFPQIKFKAGEKYLWNPIHKKFLKNRPEERIRLRVIEYLLDAGWSKHRISTEEGISSSQQGNLRTDLICYTKDFNPFLLIECKAAKVNLSKQTAEQIARYNKEVNAPYLLITNGETDLWYSFENDDKPVIKQQVPEPFDNGCSPREKPFEFWVKRGFAGRQAQPELRKWITPLLDDFFRTGEFDYRYLSFNQNLYDLNLNQYYGIFNFSEVNIALAFVATAFGDTRLVAIKNKNGENTDVLEVNLDLLFKQQIPNASLYNQSGSTNLDIRQELDWDEDEFQLASFSKKVRAWLDS